MKRKSTTKRKKAESGVSLPKPPEKPVIARFSLAVFYSFTIMKLVVAVLMLAVVTLAILTPLFSRMTIIPCKVLDIFPYDARCPVNPAAPAVSTVYFSNSMLDQLYSVAYLIVFFILVPYTLGCAGVFLYKRYFGSSE